MSNITMRKSAGPLTSLFETREPLRWMENLLRWDPFGEMAPVTGPIGAVFAPAFEIKESKEAYQFRADLPGVKEKDLEVTIGANRLIIAGSREAEKIEETDQLYAAERTYGAFNRTFTLPEGIDVEHVRGELKEGVLTVVVPKLHGAQGRKVTLEVPKSRA